MKRKIIQTKDGSSSLFIPELNETYHSIHGAKQEAEHVFLKMGFDKVVSNFDLLNILEVGLGTGLNAGLTFQYLKEGQKINYTAIEKYPLILDEVIQLNYSDFIGADLLDKIHNCDWGQKIKISKHFEFIKFNADLKDFTFNESFNLIYFDAFAPNKQPNMWSYEVFLKMYNTLEKGGLLTTYCCQGEVKRTLQKVGFSVEKVIGPPGKREMINAWKI